jgi:phenylacetic acid degradation operon negative regulatory protein
MVIVASPGASAADRTLLRDTLRQLRFRYFRDGIWIRPNNIEIVLPADVADRATSFVATPTGSAVELAERVFRPTEWAEAAETSNAAWAAGCVIDANSAVSARSTASVCPDPRFGAARGNFVRLDKIRYWRLGEYQLSGNGVTE